MLDPDGEHEALEQAWTAALPNGWPPTVDNEEFQRGWRRPQRDCGPLGATRCSSSWRR